jgi:hypothetical protein
MQLDNNFKKDTEIKHTSKKRKQLKIGEAEKRRHMDLLKK